MTHLAQQLARILEIGIDAGVIPPAAYVRHAAAERDSTPRCACGAVALVLDDGAAYCETHRPPLRTLARHARAVLVKGAE